MRKIFLIAIALMLVTAAPASSEGWKYNTALYGWLSGMSGTIGVAGLDGQPVDASFEDLASYLDFAMGVHFEAVNPKMVLLTDIWYVNLGSTMDGEAANEPVTVEFDMVQWIVELAWGYRVSEDFTFLVAGRYYILDMGETSSSVAGGTSTETSQSWGDLYIGARYNKLFKEKWIVALRGDIGAGGSSFAWFGEATLGYRFTERWSAIAAYRILDLDHTGDEGDNYFKYDMTQNGLGVGVGFSF